MPKGPDGEASDALLGALVTILSIFVVALLALVCYLYFQLRRIHRQYKELLRESTVTTALSQRIREQRKSAISNMIAEDIEQQRGQIISSPISQRSGYSTNSSRCDGAEVFANDITCIEPGSPESEPWAIRKVRSMERLTGLTNELSTKPERRDPFQEPAHRIEDRNPFYNRGGSVRCKLRDVSRSNSAQNKKSDKEEVSEPAPSKARTLETAKSASHQKINEEVQKMEAVCPTLLAVPQTISPTRSQSVRPKFIIGPPDSDEKPESGSNVPPHARSPPPQFPSEDPSRIANKIYLTNSDDNSSDLDGLDPYDTYDVPRPFIDRSFSLNLAFSDLENNTDNNRRSSRGTKLKHYLKTARNNRRSLASAAGRFSRRPPTAMTPKTKRGLVRLPKSSKEPRGVEGLRNEGLSHDKLETIDEFQKEF
ncbi:hypothetical protein TWF281_000017 [Arthrobotrys megalospora]